MSHPNYDSIVMARVTDEMRNGLKKIAKDQTTTESDLLRQALLHVLRKNGVRVQGRGTWSI